jgi:hypothetical protein
MVSRDVGQTTIGFPKHAFDDNLIVLGLSVLDFLKFVKKSFDFVLAILAKNIFFVIISILHNGKQTYN